MNIKPIVVGIIIGLIIGTALTVSASTWVNAYRNDAIKVTLNGEEQTFKDATTGEIELPLTYNNRTYLPLRSLANLVGVDVDYDAETKTAILEKNHSFDDLIGEAFESLDYTNSLRCDTYSGIVEISPDGTKVTYSDKDGSNKMESKTNLNVKVKSLKWGASQQNELWVLTESSLIYHISGADPGHDMEFTKVECYNAYDSIAVTSLGHNLGLVAIGKSIKNPYDSGEKYAYYEVIGPSFAHEKIGE